MNRRTLLQWASAGFVAAQWPELAAAQACSGENHTAPDQPYVPRFFTAEELHLLDQAMEAILPADAHSAGAHAAQVPLFADLMVSTSPADVQRDWRAGLRSLASELRVHTLHDVLTHASAQEHNPQSPLDLFFLTLKQMTVEGYYTSRIGIHDELRYQGNTYVQEFKGCTHAEHQNQS